MTKKKQIIYDIVWAIIIAICVFMIALFINRAEGLSPFSASVAAIDIICMIISVPIYMSTLRHKGMRTLADTFLWMLLVNVIYLASNCVHYMTDREPGLAEVNGVMNIIYRVCPVVLTLLFWRFLDSWNENTKKRPRAGMILKIAAVVDMIYIACNIFGRYLFDVSKETGQYMRGPLTYTSAVFPFLAIIVFLIRIVLSRQQMSDKLILMVYPVFPFVVAVIQLATDGPSLVPVAVFFSFLLFYTNLFVRRGREILARERDLTLSRLQVLQMQINPHFLYNTLASVGSLCDSDPEAAQEMVYSLSDYLHDNFTDIQTPSLISFSDELKHLRTYCNIQKVRFPDISVSFDLKAGDFLIPAMTLQPLVENSIRHGLRKVRDREGVITIATEENDENWIVSVKDNGAGFTPEDISKDEKEHIGIANIRTRLGILCEGSLEIESSPGEGTSCRIIIPKKQKMQDVLHKILETVRKC